MQFLGEFNYQDQSLSQTEEKSLLIGYDNNLKKGVVIKEINK